MEVADDGGFARLSRAQILALLKPPKPAGPRESSPFRQRRRSFIIAEVIGDMGFVLMTRVKDLGSG